MIVLGAATVTSASSTFIKFHDKRILYRKSAEQIKEETMLYITHTGKYNTEERDEQFVLELDRITKGANKEWRRIEEKKEERKEEKKKAEKKEEVTREGEKEKKEEEKRE